MRWQEIMESPIGDYELMGDFDDPQSSFMRKKENDLIHSEKHQVRLRTIMENSPYRFNVYFVSFNIDKLTKKLKTMRFYKDKSPVNKEQRILMLGEEFGGEFTSAEIEQLFDVKIPADNNGITYMMGAAGFSDPTQHLLSSWLIIHRFIHSIENGVLFHGKHTRLSGQTKKYFSAYNSFVENNLDYLKDQATMASARNNNLNAIEEVSTELLTQYFIKGKITLKTDKKLEIKLNRMSESLFKNCVGKIFVGF